MTLKYVLEGLHIQSETLLRRDGVNDNFIFIFFIFYINFLFSKGEKKVIKVLIIETLCVMNTVPF